MTAPWTDGPHELLQHAVDHLAKGGDFDRRIAMVSIDNAVELMVKTYLGLPKRARSSPGPSRKALDSASESFPALLDLLDTHASDRIVGFSLDDIEWYHRIRNQLYHSGNGITVERSKVETYFELALILFENLFSIRPNLTHTDSIRTKTGEFLGMWVAFQRHLRTLIPKCKNGAVPFTFRYKLLNKVSPDGEALYKSLAQFRNEVVHGLQSHDVKELQENIDRLEKLIKLLSNLPNQRIQ